MKHYVSAPKQLIVPIALALTLAPALKAAESSGRFHLDGKPGGIERVSARPALSDDKSGVQEAAPQTSPQASPTEQRTVKAPQVSYEDGQLTIIAENSALSDVMNALRSALGADIDLPAGVADQHIWAHLGPGPARRVLRDLLDGTEFNYVIQASESDANGIQSVLLTQRSKSTGAEKAGAPERSAVRSMPGHGSDTQSSTDSENPSPEPVASAHASQATSPASSSAPPPASPANGSADSASLQNPPGNSDSSPLKAGSSSSPGSPSDPMIQQLQSMYQQRRQLQMQQNQKPTGQN